MVAPGLYVVGRSLCHLSIHMYMHNYRLVNFGDWVVQYTCLSLKCQCLSVYVYEGHTFFTLQHIVVSRALINCLTHLYYNLHAYII